MLESKYKSIEDKEGYVCPDVICREDTGCGITVEKAVESALGKSHTPLNLEDLKNVVFSDAPQKAQSEWDIEKTIESFVRVGRVEKDSSGYVLARDRKGQG